MENSLRHSKRVEEKSDGEGNEERIWFWYGEGAGNAMVTLVTLGFVALAIGAFAVIANVVDAFSEPEDQVPTCEPGAPQTWAVKAQSNDARAIARQEFEKDGWSDIHQTFNGDDKVWGTCQAGA